MRRALRVRIYALVACGYFLLAVVGTRFGPEFNFIFSDGRAYYVYLPSAVIDGDLDFSDEIREDWKVGFRPLRIHERTERGLVRNKFPIGLALSLAPAFLIAHALALGFTTAGFGAAVAPTGFSAPYQVLCLASILALATLTLKVADRWLTERYGIHPWAALAAAVSFWIGTHYAYYSFREAFMVHVVSAFWTTLAADLAVRARERTLSLGERERLLLSFSVSMAIVCRFSNAAILAPFLIALAWEAARSGALRKLVGPGLVVGALPLLLQAWVWWLMTGHALQDPYGREGFKHWRNPYLWSTLFSTNRGLFFWSPLLLLAVFGVTLHLRARGLDPLLRGWLLGAASLWYLNSAWWAWAFGEAFGARAFLELTGLFVLGLGFAFHAVLRAPGLARAVTVGFVLGAVVWNWALMYLFTVRWIPRMGRIF